MKWTDILSWLFNVHKKVHVLRPVDHRHPPPPTQLLGFLKKIYIYAIETNQNNEFTGLQNRTFPPMVSIV